MKSILGIAAGIILGATSAQAIDANVGPFTVHTAIIPPYITDASGGQANGVIMEIIQGALSAAGINHAIQDEVPWRRAQSEAIDQPNTLISPFARTEGRENNWTWIAVILEENMMVYVPPGADGPNNVEELAQTGAIGVVAGGAAQSILESLGISEAMQIVNADEDNVKKMVAGRIEAWLSQGYQAAASLRNAEVSPESVDARFVLRELPLWVATSKQTPPETVEALRAAFGAFVGSPAYQEILSRYQ
jgi:polar amino acid transport system substrate-binding protein